MEHLSALRDALSKAEAKEKRLASQLDAARTEREELETALRVVERLTGATAQAGASSSQSENGQLIYGFVGEGPEAAKLPKEIIEDLRKAGHALGDDLVRTQLWRMARRKELHKHDGRYFRPVAKEFSYEDIFDENEEAPDAEATEAYRVGRVAELEGPEKTEQHPSSKGENVGSSPTPTASTQYPQLRGWDYDVDPPF